MPVIVNGYEFNDAEMEQELPNHQDAADAMQSAMTALVLCRVLLDEARQLQLQANKEDELIEALLRQEVNVPMQCAWLATIMRCASICNCWLVVPRFLASICLAQIVPCCIKKIYLYCMNSSVAYCPQLGQACWLVAKNKNHIAMNYWRCQVPK